MFDSCPRGYSLRVDAAALDEISERGVYALDAPVLRWLAAGDRVPAVLVREHYISSSGEYRALLMR